MTRVNHGIEVHGLDVDAQTRCRHYHSDVDIIAIRFACCDRYYPCNECHRETADHEPSVWPASRFDEAAVLCGACGRQLTVNEYLGCGHRCPSCSAAFNPGCAAHRHLYFESN